MTLRRLPLVIVLAVVAVGCSILPPELAHELLPSQTQYATASAAFQIIIDKHVDKPSSTTLIPGALDSVATYLKTANIDANPVVDRPTLTGSEWSDFAKLSASLDAVLARYPNAKKDLMERAAVDGMARSMNECHTYYLDPDRAKTFNRPPAPVSGIGVTINQSDPNSPIEVIDVIPNTPAEKAGVRKGDKIMKVNGEDVSKLTTGEVADRVRGPEGTPVTIVFDRGGTPVELTITRARFTTPLTESRLESGDIAYVRIKQLISTVADDAASPMDDAIWCSQCVTGLLELFTKNSVWSQPAGPLNTITSPGWAVVGASDATVISAPSPESCTPGFRSSGGVMSARKRLRQRT